MAPPPSKNPTVKAAIEAFQAGDRKAWSALFEEDAELFDDGSPRSLEKFTRDAIGHERFTSFDRVNFSRLRGLPSSNSSASSSNSADQAFRSPVWNASIAAFTVGFFEGGGAISPL